MWFPAQRSELQPPVMSSVPYFSQTWPHSQRWATGFHQIATTAFSLMLINSFLQLWRSQDHSVIWISKSKLGHTSADLLYSEPHVICAKKKGKVCDFLKKGKLKIQVYLQLWNSCYATASCDTCILLKKEHNRVFFDIHVRFVFS